VVSGDRYERARLAGSVVVVIGLLVIAVVGRLSGDPVKTDLIDLTAAPYRRATLPDRHIEDVIASAMGDDDATDRLLDRLSPAAAAGIDPRSFEEVQDAIGGGPLTVDGVLERTDDLISVLATGPDGVLSVSIAVTPGRPGQIEGVLLSPVAGTDDGPLSDVEAVVFAVAMLALVGVGLVGRSHRWYVPAGLATGCALLETIAVPVLQNVAIVAIPTALVLAMLAVAGCRSRWPIAVVATSGALSLLPVLAIDPGDARSFGHLVTVESLVGEAHRLQRVAAVAASTAAVAVAAWAFTRLRRSDRRGERWRLAGGGVGCIAIGGVSLAGLIEPAAIDLTVSGWSGAALLAVAAGHAAQLLLRHGDLTGVGAAIADLGAGRSADLPAVIGRALDDPTVMVLHARGEEFVDSGGCVSVLPDDPRRFTVLAVDGETVGAIVHAPAAAADPERLRAACDAVKLSLANERLTAQIRWQLDEVRASRQRLVHAEERARERIERDLHDGAQQRLTAAMLGLRVVQADVSETAPDVAARIDPIGAELQRAIDEIRELARGVRPTVLDSGLDAAVNDLAERAALPVTVRSSLRGRVTPDVETIAYFVVSEALTNATRHADATHVTIALDEGHDWLTVAVVDDGAGGSVCVGPGERPVSSGGTGLVGIFDRVDAHGGTLAVDSALGGGTTVTVRLPCAS
jgi:signal transduction histidine kinase